MKILKDYKTFILENQRTRGGNQGVVSINIETENGSKRRFTLNNQTIFKGEVIGEEISTSKKYTLVKKLGNEYVKRNIIPDDFLGDWITIVKYNGELYQIQSTSTPPENYILPDFNEKLKEIFKKD